jgi:hypothetical protein
MWNFVSTATDQLTLGKWTSQCRPRECKFLLFHFVPRSPVLHQTLRQ